jgi:hypothetical protein
LTQHVIELVAPTDQRAGLVGVDPAQLPAAHDGVQRAVVKPLPALAERQLEDRAPHDAVGRILEFNCHDGWGSNWLGSHIEAGVLRLPGEFIRRIRI